MSEIQFQRGTFLPFRAVTKIHLGAIQDDLSEGEVVFFDGMTLKRGDAEHVMPIIKAAVKQGWLVPEGEEGAYIPQPAGVTVRAAQSTGENRGEAKTMGRSIDDQRDLGNREDIRRGMKVSAADNPAEDMKVVGKVPASKVAAAVGREGAVKAKPIEVGRADQAIVAMVSNVDGNDGVRMVKTTPNRVGDDLEDVLPEAPSSGRPDPGIHKEKTIAEELERLQQEAKHLLAKKAQVSASPDVITGTEAVVSSGGEFKTPKATFHSGGDSIGGAEDGEVIGTVSKGPVAKSAEDTTESDAVIQAKIEMIQQFVPGFQWDMKAHWQTRVKQALRYKKNMPVLNAILSIETDAVRKFVLKALYGEGQ